MVHKLYPQSTVDNPSLGKIENVSIQKNFHRTWSLLTEPPIAKISIHGFPKSKIGENVVYPFRFTRRHRAGRKIP